MAHSSRQVKGTLAGALALLLLGAISASTAIADLPQFDRVRILQSATNIPDAQLTDVDGEPFRLSDLYGRVGLIFFGFTNCPDVCPSALAKLMDLQRSERIDNSQVAIVIISVDGERDTPEAMKTFLANFSEDFIGLTGDPEDVQPIAKKFRAAFYKGSPTDKGYSVSHSPQVFVVDTSGALRAEFYNASIDAMVGVTDALLAESSAAASSGGN